MDWFKTLFYVIYIITTKKTVKEKKNFTCYVPIFVCLKVSELQLWLEEQQVGLESRDCGRSEEVTEAMLRKLDSVAVELDNQRRTVEKLQENGASLQHLRHPKR